MVAPEVRLLRALLSRGGVTRGFVGRGKARRGAPRQSAPDGRIAGSTPATVPTSRESLGRARQPAVRRGIALQSKGPSGHDVTGIRG
jgi:hypothetical protein